ncbi:N-acylglucosamine 2-epimerase [Lewinella marina]|uniref:N-acylglucosamine 2-epimerase n=1 Tax=Neolewinella marina TaxID=438751 RepID=A0A2G0CCJ4_9BACT|nr:AGE family epimerase/isomerase [Neolewinella marina]NJB87626.1 N-acylglucosamine 2-epimerase [Neolewinella marina]PHK97686.1 N-acylglucosamine 2-epimerase [Neolewinella marina]
MSYASLYQRSLLDDVLPFWERHSPDPEHGGYFSCLTREGKVYDTDKFIWLQGRQAWLFASLYNRQEARPEWLELARSGVEFLRRFGMDAAGDHYFAVTREGKPLVQPYNIFSDCFAAMAYSQYGKAAGDDTYRALARSTYARILKRADNPKGGYEKSTGVRKLRGFALPMILSNLVLELEDVLAPAHVEAALDRSVYEVMEVFLRPDSGLIHEFVDQDGTLHDSMDGRLINPGHGIEAMWFMMDIGQRRNDPVLIDRAARTVVRTLEFAWDTRYGGIYYFIDAQGYPTQQLEWYQKLWWVHLETLVALSKAWSITGDDTIRKWYERVHEYTWKHFPDPQYGEWYGYLNRRGEPLLTLKGGKWKGCFHVPRALWQCARAFETLERQTAPPASIDQTPT